MPPIARITDGPLKNEIELYHFGAQFENDDPPIEVKFSKLPEERTMKWVRIPEDVPGVPWDIVYRLVQIRPVDDIDGDPVYAYARVSS